jgi:4-amino-4-deoxy-L-arabinose transferase-like glycosyltransferase
VTLPVVAADWRADRQWWVALAILGVGAAIRIALAARLPLFPDEAYYWLWTQHLSAGYFDHPPMIAWLIAGGSAVVGHSPLGVRVLPVIAGSVGVLAVAAAARRLAGSVAATTTAAAMTAMPLAAAGLVLATPDAPLLGYLGVGLYALVRALDHGAPPQQSLRWWLVAGWMLGLGMLSKYTAVIFAAGVLIAMVSHPYLRRRFAERGPYLAVLLAIAAFSPTLFWNAGHDWMSFRFQIDHGLGSAPTPLLLRLWRNEGDLIGGQLGLVSPILFGTMAVAVVRAARSRERPIEQLLGIASLFVFLFFAMSASRRRVEPNWLAPAYLGGVILVASCVWTERATAWVRSGVTMAAVLSAVVYVHAVTPVLPVPPAKDPIARSFGWQDLAGAATRAAAEPGAAPGSNVWIAADRYQDASEISFYGNLGPRVFALNLAGRPNQFDLWPRFRDRARKGDRLVLALDDTRDPHAAIVSLRPHFTSILLGELVELKRDDAVIGRRRIYVLDGWLGSWP